MKCKNCNTTLKSSQSDSLCQDCKSVYDSAQTDFTKRLKKKIPRNEITWDVDDSSSEEKSVIEDLYEWIAISLSHYEDSLVTASVEESLRREALQKSIHIDSFQKEFSRYLVKTDKSSEKELIITAAKIFGLNLEAEEEPYLLVPANKHQNFFNKVKRAIKNEKISKVWLISFMKKHNVISEKEAKENLFEWLEDCLIVKNLKKKSYSPKERDELDKNCPNFDFLKSSNGIEKRTLWIDRWLSDNGYELSKGFFSRLFGS